MMHVIWEPIRKKAFSILMIRDRFDEWRFQALWSGYFDDWSIEKDIIHSYDP